MRLELVALREEVKALHVTLCNVTPPGDVTKQVQNVTLCNEIENNVTSEENSPSPSLSPLNGPLSSQHSPLSPIIPSHSTLTPNLLQKVAQANTFKRPTAEDVAGYFREISVSMEEARKFWDHFQSNGWKVGRNSMKDWKAAARNWGRRVSERQAQTSGRTLDSMAEEMLRGSQWQPEPTNAIVNY